MSIAVLLIPCISYQSFQRRCTAVSRQSLKIPSTVSMQLRTTQYHTIPWTTTQYHAILQSIQYSRVELKSRKGGKRRLWLCNQPFGKIRGTIKKRSKFSHLLTVRAEGADPGSVTPPSALTVSKCENFNPF